MFKSRKVRTEEWVFLLFVLCATLAVMFFSYSYTH